MPLKLALPKFIGTISLGLLTGLSYTLTTTTYPALLHLPSATHASRTYATISTTAQRHALALAALALVSFTTAFGLAPTRARHPYLLWTALLAGGSVAPDAYKLARALVMGGPSTMRAKEEEEWEDVEERGINGEEVERRVREAQLREVRRGAVGGLAFALGVVGLWGDGA